MVLRCFKTHINSNKLTHSCWETMKKLSLFRESRTFKGLIYQAPVVNYKKSTSLETCRRFSVHTLKITRLVKGPHSWNYITCIKILFRNRYWNFQIHIVFPSHQTIENHSSIFSAWNWKWSPLYDKSYIKIWYRAVCLIIICLSADYLIYVYIYIYNRSQ